jgi:hypothetical protein
MTDQEILVTGELCEALLASTHFTTILGQYELTIAADVLSTSPHEAKKREHLYATLWGARGLLEYMKLNAASAAQIKADYNKPPVTTDETALAYEPDELRDEDEENDY